MKIDYAFLCDAAAESGGKVHAIGIGFERITVSQLPSVHPRAVAVVRFGFTRDDAGLHVFRLRVLDADGNNVSPPVEGQINLDLGPDSDRGKANMIMDLVQLELHSAGPYEVSVTMDDREFVSLPFEVGLAG